MASGACRYVTPHVESYFMAGREITSNQNQTGAEHLKLQINQPLQMWQQVSMADYYV